VRFPKTVIGFGLKNNGSFNDQASGIAGFGGGSLSLISQMGSSVGRKSPTVWCLFYPKLEDRAN